MQWIDLEWLFSIDRKFPVSLQIVLMKRRPRHDIVMLFLRQLTCYQTPINRIDSLMFAILCMKMRDMMLVIIFVVHRNKNT